MPIRPTQGTSLLNSSLILSDTIICSGVQAKYSRISARVRGTEPPHFQMPVLGTWPQMSMCGGEWDPLGAPFQFREWGAYPG
jgi:hypothetical protein